MRLLTMLILPVVVGGSASAQTTAATTATATAQDPRTAELGHFPPVIVLEVRPALRLTSETFSIYAPFDRPPREGGTRFLAARRLTTGPGGDKIEWARISDCPGASEALEALERLQAPIVDVPTLGAEERVFPPPDGVTFALWSRWPKWPGAIGYELSLTSNLGTPLADWAQSFKTTMASCWTAEAPTAWK